MKSVWRVSAAALLAVLLAVPASFAKDKKQDPDAIGDRDVAKGVNFYSIEKEIALGKQMAQEVEHQAKIVNDPVISEYVNRIGQNLVRNSDAKVPFTIKVIDSDEVNAFALPGGFLFVNTGLIRKADNEAQLAGVLAHEIAHVAARHGTRQATRGQLVNFASLPLIFMGGWAGYGVSQAANLAIPLTFLKFSRGFEEEADFLGLQYMYKAGYDPTAVVDFFEKLQSEDKKKPGSISKVFSTHPMTKDRVRRAQEEIQKNLKPRQEYAVTSSEFNDVKARLQTIQAKRKVDDKDPNRPTLRRSPRATPASDGADTKQTGKDNPDDDRPTLKRKS